MEGSAVYLSGLDDGGGGFGGGGLQSTKLGDSSSRASSASSSLGLLPPPESSRLSTPETPSAISYQLSSGELAGIIVAAAVVTAAVIIIVVVFHVRRRKSKSAQLSAEMAGPSSAPQISVISMDTDVKAMATRQNSLNGYNGPLNSPYGRTANGGQSLGGSNPADEFAAADGDEEYGSVMGSFPPSPALSFRSAVDAPGFSRSRAGTGTSFGTVASFSSHRSYLSATASFHTCVEEEFH